MIKANTEIIVGSKIFRPGQTVTGLSRMDKEWMKSKGYITEYTGRKEQGEQEKGNDDI